MKTLDLTEETLKAEIVKAREEADRADASLLRAKCAYYEPNYARIAIELLNGASVLIPAELVQGLAGASPDDLAELEVTPSGEGLHWEKLDVDMSIPALILGIFGTKTWMAELRSKGGSVTSP